MGTEGSLLRYVDVRLHLLYAPRRLANDEPLCLVQDFAAMDY